MYDPSALIDASFRSALSLLLKASQYALDSRSDRWQFAVELSELTSAGRDAHRHSLADPARLWRARQGDHRAGRRRTVVSKLGADQLSNRYVRGAFQRRGLDPGPRVGPLAAGSRPVGRRHAPAESEQAGAIAPAHTIPDWDATRRELRYRGQVVKRYRVPAKNQSLVLTAFQEEGWPGYIDDPLASLARARFQAPAASHDQVAESQPANPADQVSRQRQRTANLLGSNRAGLNRVARLVAATLLLDRDA